TALVEAHNRTELELAADIGAELIGVNSRNPKALSVDTDRFEPLAGLVPAGTTLVAESGVTGAREGAKSADAAADLSLAGEALGTGGRPQAAVEEYTAIGRDRRLSAS